MYIIPINFIVLSQSLGKNMANSIRQISKTTFSLIHKEVFKLGQWPKTYCLQVTLN